VIDTIRLSWSVAAMPPECAPSYADRWLTLAPAILLAALAAIFFGVRVWYGIWFSLFADESEHILGGMALNHGAILYRTFIDAHGPVTFMLTQAYGAVLGWSYPNGVRLIPACLALCSGGCIVTSAAMTRRITKLWAISLFFGLLASVWLLQAVYMVNYHGIAGFLMSIGLALFVVPVWLRATVTRLQASLAGASFMLVVLTAYAFVPAICLLTASAILAAKQGSAKQAIAAFIAGGAAGFVAVLIWLIIFGDLTGYIIFHFITNQFIYSHYLHDLNFLSASAFLSSVVPSFQPIALVHCLALVCMTVSLAIFCELERRQAASLSMYASIIIGFIGLLVLCVRGGTLFQDGCFVVAAITLAAMSIAIVLEHIESAAVTGLLTLRHAMLGSLLIGVCIAGSESAMRRAITSPSGLTRRTMGHDWPVSMGISPYPEYARIRQLTAPNERVLVMPYKPFVNLWAGRLPMDKYTAYLPWDADYAKAPWFGRDRDLCADMTKSPPKLVYFDDWIVWGRWRMADYAPCFIAILAKDYIRQTDFPDLYLRRDHPAS
jgi:hypothetical protein